MECSARSPRSNAARVASVSPKGVKQPVAARRMEVFSAEKLTGKVPFTQNFFNREWTRMDANHDNPYPYLLNNPYSREFVSIRG
jgi:hypothetical protein